MLTANDFVALSWKEYQKHIEHLAQEIKNFLEHEKISVDFIVPILRGGGIPAISLAYQLNVFQMYSIQLKHEYENKKIIVLKNDFEYVSDEAATPTILLVDGYHATGKTTYMTYDLIKRSFPLAKIIYSTLGRDVGYLEDKRDFAFTCHAFISNECGVIDKKQSAKDGMLTKYTLFPWENLDDELKNMNDELKYEG